MIKNFNTVEEYRNADKMAMLQEAGKKVRNNYLYICVVFLICTLLDSGCYKRWINICSTFLAGVFSHTYFRRP